ncbi:MAG: gfo/Idh/MocA family oxidoreductase [Spirochaetaceae bacterium]|nr:MAG: gfo/Idh/MocA family oxidoreductase [Spirochaetaceae bacterium]
MKKRYALIGTGSRSRMYVNAVCKEYTDVAELVAINDINPTRMERMNEYIASTLNGKRVATYGPHQFDQMIAESKPDVVIVTSMDRTHHRYICRAMDLGCDVITEKPMTTDAEKCQQIIDTVERTGRNLTVTFNYRYSPRATRVKEVIADGTVGDILSVHFEWLLDTKHGADYFRRWHRDKANSGGLLVHKATHHFDLVNWWLGTAPERVFAMGRLGYYGRRNAEERGELEFYYRGTGSAVAKKDPFAVDLAADDNLKGMYLDAEKHDGYLRDQSVFGDGISIEDTMGVLVQYRSKAIMSYSLNAHCPWEGFRVMFNGTKGRLEFNVVEKSYVSGSADDINLAEQREYDEMIKGAVPIISFQPHWGRREEITFTEAVGGHGGGDVRMLDHIFRGATDDPLGHAADYVQGAYSILTGIAANRALATELPVDVRTLVKLPR